MRLTGGLTYNFLATKNEVPKLRAGAKAIFLFTENSDKRPKASTSSKESKTTYVAQLTRQETACSTD